MASAKIAAIMRSGAYSPNHVGNDATILSTVAEQLRKRGCEVAMYSEERFASGAVGEDVIINMCREGRSIEALQRAEEQGRLVINSGYGIENCILERQTRILRGSGISMPESLIVDTDMGVRRRLQEMGIDRCWVKRADAHPQHKEDVSYVRTAEEAQDVLQEFFLRGFRRAVISRHIPGKLIKFYGVAASPFFSWHRPYEAATAQADPQEVKATGAALRALCRRAAAELGVAVYGGECMQGADGALSLIGINDWPSFSSCRTEAAAAIAKMVVAAVKQRQAGA